MKNKTTNSTHTQNVYILGTQYHIRTKDDWTELYAGKEVRKNVNTVPRVQQW